MWDMELSTIRASLAPDFPGRAILKKQEKSPSEGLISMQNRKFFSCFSCKVFIHTTDKKPNLGDPEKGGLFFPQRKTQNPPLPKTLNNVSSFLKLIRSQKTPFPFCYIFLQIQEKSSPLLSPLSLKKKFPQKESTHQSNFFFEFKYFPFLSPIHMCQKEKKVFIAFHGSMRPKPQAPKPETRFLTNKHTHNPTTHNPKPHGVRGVKKKKNVG